VPQLRLAAFVLLASSSIAHAAPPPEREVAVVEVGGKAPVVLSVIRQRLTDGGLKLRLLITQKDSKQKAKSVTLYEGGADEDGPTDKSFRSATVEPFALPAGKRGARVDFEFQVPGSKKFRQVDSYLVSIDETPRLVLDTTTRRERKRSKVCNEVEVSTLSPADKSTLAVRTVSTLESELNDDDLPIDKSCKGKQPGQTIVYKFDGDTYFQIDPPPAAKKPKPSEEETD
jgi:hypothetical protein